MAVIFLICFLGPVQEEQARLSRDFPGGLVLKNPPANAGDTDSIPGLGRFHMQWGI